MDEYLFISMAKLGADRLKKERVERAAAQLAAVNVPRVSAVAAKAQRSAAVQVAPQPVTLNSRLAVFSLALAIGLGMAGLGGWYAAARDAVPNGSVYITELDLNGKAPSDVTGDVTGNVTVAQNAGAATLAR